MACPPGSFSALPGSGGCVPCTAGTYSNRDGAAHCLPCPPHTFAPSSGHVVCVDCTKQGPFRFTNATGSQFCRECDRDRYLLFNNRSDPSTFVGCTPCPPNADCTSGAPVAAAKYWLDVDPASGRVTVYPCSNSAACTDIGECAVNRKPASENPLCAACETGFQEWGSECVRCEEAQYGIIFGLVVFLFVFVLLYHFLSQAASPFLGVVMYFLQMVLLFIGTQSSAGGAYVLSTVNIDLLAAGGDSCIFPVSEHGRVIAGFVGPMLAFGAWALLALLSYVLHNVGILPIQSQSKLWWSLQRRQSIEQARQSRQSRQSRLPHQPRQPHLAPVLSHISSPAAVSAHGEQSEPDMRNNDFVLDHISSMYDVNRWYRSLIALYLFTFNGIIGNAFTVFNCITVTSQGSSLEVLQAYPTIECSGSTYNGLLTIAAVITVLYLATAVIFTAVLGYLYVQQRNRSNAPNNGEASDSVSAPKGLHPMQISHHAWGVLTDVFRHRFFFWKMWVLARRLILVAIAVFATDNRGWQLTALTAVNTFILLVHIIFKPFLHRLDNVMESVALSVLTLLTMVLRETEPPFSDSESDLLLAMWLVPFIIFMLWTVSGKLIKWGWCPGQVEQELVAILKAPENDGGSTDSDGYSRPTSGTGQLRATGETSSSTNIEWDRPRSAIVYDPPQRTNSSRASILIARDIKQKEAAADAIIDTPAFEPSQQIELSQLDTDTLWQQQLQQLDLDLDLDLDTPNDASVGLPPGWQQFTTDDGVPYYFHSDTHVTTWEKPELT
jgi:WW domain/Tyrosine-protein kinase ephrin type A/B receptor-like